MAFHGSCQPLQTSEEANGGHKLALNWYNRYQAMVYHDSYILNLKLYNTTIDKLLFTQPYLQNCDKLYLLIGYLG